MTNEEIIKKVGNYQIKMNTTFDSKKSDQIYLKLDLSEDLLNLLKNSVIKEEHSQPLYVGGNQTFIRYKVKGWIYGSLYGDKRDYLFLKELIDTGKVIIPFDSTSEIESVIDSIKSNIRYLIKTVLKYQDLSMTVSYDLKMERED